MKFMRQQQANVTKINKNKCNKLIHLFEKKYFKKVKKTNKINDLKIKLINHQL